MSYQPQPGTIPYRAVKWMKSMESVAGNGPWSTAQLCEGIDVETNGFVTCMKPAIAAGLVKPQKIAGKGKSLWWELGDGKPEAKPDDFTYDISMSPRPRVKVRPGPLFPGVNASRPSEVPFRVVGFFGRVIVTGVQIIDGAAVFTPEQFNALRGGA